MVLWPESEYSSEGGSQGCGWSGDGDVWGWGLGCGVVGVTSLAPRCAEGWWSLFVGFSDWGV